MSVRIYDPKTPEIFRPALCTAGCGKEYHSICRLCNLAFCFGHLKLEPHACDTKREYRVLTHDEVVQIFVGPDVEVVEILEPEVEPQFYTTLPLEWDESPKGCHATNPESREICQLRPDGHQIHMRKHPDGLRLLCWVGTNGTVK